LFDHGFHCGYLYSFVWREYTSQIVGTPPFFLRAASVTLKECGSSLMLLSFRLLFHLSSFDLFLFSFRNDVLKTFSLKFQTDFLFAGPIPYQLSLHTLLSVLALLHLSCEE
jgi:hypothetical protein